MDFLVKLSIGHILTPCYWQMGECELNCGYVELLTSPDVDDNIMANHIMILGNSELTGWNS